MKIKFFLIRAFLIKMNMQEYGNVEYSPSNTYYSYNYNDYYSSQIYSNYENSYVSYSSTPSSNSSTSNYSSPQNSYFNSRDLNSPILNYNDYSINYLPYPETSLTTANNTSNNTENENISSVSSINQIKKNKRPRVVKLDLTQTSIGFGVPQKVSKLKENQVSELESQLKCSMCSKSFKSSAKLFMHQHKYHKNGSSLQCPICLKKFNSQANALVHVRAHTQEKSYKCHICSVGFCDSSTLKKHLRTHTGEKPYECHLCPKRFTQSGNLKRHLTVHEKYDVIQAKHLNKSNEKQKLESENTTVSIDNLNIHFDNGIIKQDDIQNDQFSNINWYSEQNNQIINGMNLNSDYKNVQTNYYNNQYYYSNSY